MSREAIRRLRGCWVLVFAACLIVCAVAQDTAQKSTSGDSVQSAPAAIPVVDAEMGPCSVDFTVTDPSFKPVRDAKVRVRISYGFMGVRRLDLEVGTNVDGKARFVGLPNNLKRALYFYAEQGKLRGTSVNDAALKCKASHILTMRESAEAADETSSDDSGDKPPVKTPDSKPSDSNPADRQEDKQQEKPPEQPPDHPENKPQR